MVGGTGRNPHVFSILVSPEPDPENGEAVREVGQSPQQDRHSPTASAHPPTGQGGGGSQGQSRGLVARHAPATQSPICACVHAGAPRTRAPAGKLRDGGEVSCGPELGRLPPSIMASLCASEALPARLSPQASHTPRPLPASHVARGPPASCLSWSSVSQAWGGPGVPRLGLSAGPLLVLQPGNCSDRFSG